MMMMMMMMMIEGRMLKEQKNDKGVVRIMSTLSTVPALRSVSIA